MKRWKKRSLILSAAVFGLLLTACQSAGNAGTRASEKGQGKHEAITIMDGNRDYGELMNLVHETYPEIQLEVEAYHGYNMSAYMSKQLETGLMPDIYSTTQLWNEEWQKEHLIDLAQYELTDRYSETRMDETEVDGATYLLPYDYNILSIIYNQSLFEREGWQVPDSFEQLQALIPQIQAAGVSVSVCELGYPGYAFQYFCNVADTMFLRTLPGQQWQNDFLAGKASSAALLQSAAYFQQWIDCGMINMQNGVQNNDDYIETFREGNTAFLIGSIDRFTQNEDGTGDRYACMPYLSEQGNSNMYITQIARYYGLSKELEKPGNEQKLADALHVLEVLSTMEGYRSIVGDTDVSICSLKNFSLSEDSPYYPVLKEIQTGHAAPLIYTGWVPYISSFGEEIRSWILGYTTKEEVLESLNAFQKQFLGEGGNDYGWVDGVLDSRQVSVLVGRIFMEAAGADGALISRNEWKPEVKAGSWQNSDGVNGKLLPGVLREEEIVSVLPTGWSGTIDTVTLSGKRILELQKAGYDRLGTGDTYPYELVTREGEKLEPETDYTIVICGAEDAVLEEGNVQDTGIVGLDAAKEYLKGKGTITADALEETD